MRRAIELARRGAGRVSPNPLVGCVVVREGRIVGEGYHLFAQRDHAEIVALRKAGSAARGADLYVTLEPCHHQGRTPPCTASIVEAGISRVFAAVEDPNPRVAGKGIAFLKRKGIEARVGDLAGAANRLNEKFFHYIRRERPFVLLKLAQTLDGRIAGAGGESRWITSEAARNFSQRLRYEYDAILVGVGTILQDNPSLDVRWKRRNPIVKVVLDSRLQTPSSARIFESGDRVLIYHAASAPAGRLRELSAKAELVSIPAGSSGLSLDSLLAHLGKARVSSLIVEGGSRVAASFLDAGEVQRIHFFYAPKILGASGLASVGSIGTGALSEAIQFEDLRLRHLPPDFLLDARVKG